jgi:anhydro-N-acetylmuramic acid kinase
MLLAHPYFAAPAPKSLDRLTFSSLIATATETLTFEDGAATLAAFTAAAIILALPATPKRLIICGGGRKNAAIMARLQKSALCPVEPAEAAGWDGDSLEAQCFAFLAVRSLYGMPLSLPATTGVPAPQTGGRLMTGTSGT